MTLRSQSRMACRIGYMSGYRGNVFDAMMRLAVVFWQPVASTLHGHAYDHERIAMFRSHRISTPCLLLLIMAALGLAVAPGRNASAATGPALSINAGADQHAISPLIYG